MDANKLKVAVLGTRGRVSSWAQKSATTLLSEVGANTGNLVFQYAATRLIDESTLHVGPGADVHQDQSRVPKECHAVVFPAANHIDLRHDLGALARWLDGFGLPVVVLGIGVQARDSSEATFQELLAAFAADAGFRQLARVLQHQRFYVGVRGEFTQRVLQHFDVPCELTGCPSFLLHVAQDLGQHLQRRFDALAARSTQRHHLCLGVTANTPYIDGHALVVEQLLLRWLQEGPGFYIQQSGGDEMVHLMHPQMVGTPAQSHALTWYRSRLGLGGTQQAFDELMAQRLRIRFSIDEWREDVSLCDMTVGSRYHGAAISMQGGVPAVVLAHDSRTEELCQSTMVPFVPMHRLNAQMSLRELVNLLVFDGPAYDRQRRLMAGRVHAALQRAGIRTAHALDCLATASGPGA